jgi:hypothetical protein
MILRRYRRGTSILVVSAMATAMALAAFGVSASSSVEAATGVPWSVTVTPTTNVSDGALVAMTLRTTEDHPIYQARAQVCRSGVAYDTSTTSRPNEDFLAGGANCPSIPISTSADVSTVNATTYSTAILPEGETFSMYVGTGVVEWISDLDGTEKSLACDFEHPCSLVIQVRGVDSDGVTRWVPFVQELRYASDDPIAGCGGVASGELATGGAERIAGAWVNLTLAQCAAQPDQGGAASTASLAGEAESMDGFSSGSLDLAYSAVGYDPAVGFGLGSAGEPLEKRPAVAVPMNLNAVVVAVGNGRSGANFRKVPYRNVRLTLDQVTQLFSGGPFEFGPYLEEFYTLNPEFRETGLYVNTSAIKVGASAVPDSQHYFFTDFLKTNRESLWKVPDNNSFNAERNLPRGVTASFPIASPSFGGVLDLYTGAPIVKRSIRALSSDAFGGIWILTDLATANSLGLSVVSIENSNGVFVAPTQASMAAAIPTMTTTEDGRLMPDPSATVPSGAAQPYPLTHVEYAIAPTEKLIDDECKARTASQDLMNTWLNYVVGDGQAVLPPGYGTLTEELRTVATAAIAKVGSEYPDCLEPPPAPTDPGSLNPSGAAGRIGSSGRQPGTTIPAAGTGGGSATTADEVAAPEMPEFSAPPAASTAAALGGLLVVLALLSTLVLSATGRLPSVQSIRARFGGVRS